MKREESHLYRCPETGCELQIEEDEMIDDEVMSGTLFTSNGIKYQIKDGMPDFSYPRLLSEPDSLSRNSYDSAAKNYNTLQRVTFEILCQNEKKFREDLIDLMRIKPNDIVLETAAGTGLNFPYIINKMNGKGNIFGQDISHGMLQEAKFLFYANIKGTVKTQGIGLSLSIGNASYLPYPDNYFDSALSFGGIGVFSDKGRAIHEMCRVIKPGGRIVFGDEGIAPWLRNSEYGKILIDNNGFYLNEAPLDLIPVEARDVNVRWVMGGAFYIVDFSLGIGEPDANFDFSIPGARGGTLNTRYYGKLEGVCPETKKMAHAAREKKNISLHDWLDQAVLSAANNDLEE